MFKWYKFFTLLVVVCLIPTLAFAGKKKWKDRDDDDDGKGSSSDGYSTGVVTTGGDDGGTTVPEPKTYLMIGTALGVIYVIRRMLKKAES